MFVTEGWLFADQFQWWQETLGESVRITDHALHYHGPSRRQLCSLSVKEILGLCFATVTTGHHPLVVFSDSLL